MSGFRTAVLIPTLQPGPWVDEAVGSVLAQDDGATLTIVIFDGGKPARGTPWIVDPRVRIIELPERVGLPAALNIGISSADTEYIARLDGDDRALPGRFRKQVDYLDAHPEVLLVASAATKIDEAGGVVGSIPPPPAPEDVRRAMLTKNVLIHPAVMARREALIRAGGYDEDLRFMEDYEMWLRLGRSGVLAVLPEPLIEYRIHASQMSHGAPASGVHIDRIFEAQRLLARHIGVSRVEAWLRRSAWRAAQARRYWRRGRALARVAASGARGTGE